MNRFIFVRYTTPLQFPTTISIAAINRIPPASAFLFLSRSICIRLFRLSSFLLLFHSFFFAPSFLSFFFFLFFPNRPFKSPPMKAAAKRSASQNGKSNSSCNHPIAQTQNAEATAATSNFVIKFIGLTELALCHTHVRFRLLRLCA